MSHSIKRARLDSPHGARARHDSEPFVERQVRSGVVLYGLSSYGYDIRVADEYRIFSAATGQLSVVDPKDIDERQWCPTVARSASSRPTALPLRGRWNTSASRGTCSPSAWEEHPRLARFRGDTRVALVDGTSASLEEMARRARTVSFWGYSIGHFGWVMVTLLEAPRRFGRDALAKSGPDNGATIACTPDYEFVTRDGCLLPADSLRPGDSLMPLYRSLARAGYEMVYQPSNRHLYPTHQLADEWNLRHGLYASQPGTHRHHIDFNRRNNRPATWSEWMPASTFGSTMASLTERAFRQKSMAPQSAYLGLAR